MTRVQILTKREQRRQIDERDQLIDFTLAGRLAGMRIDERAAGRRRKRDDLAGAPRTFEPIEQILERHPIDPDMVRADPEINRAGGRARPGHP